MRARRFAIASVIVASLCSAAASGQAVRVDQASAEQTKTAGAAFQRGNELFDAARYAEAEAAFRESLGVVAGPSSRLMLARALREQGKLLEAYAELETAAAEADALAENDKYYARMRDAASEDRSQVRALLAVLTITLRSPSGVRVEIDGHALDAAELSRPLMRLPGRVTITATAPAHVPLRREVELAAGGEVGIEVDLAAEPPPAPTAAPAPAVTPPTVVAAIPEPANHTAAWIATGVGAAGIVSFAVFGSLHNARHADLRETCVQGHCSPDRADDIDAGRTYQTIANVSLGVGAVGLGLGAVLFLTSGSNDAGLGMALGPRAAALRGRF